MTTNKMGCRCLKCREIFSFVLPMNLKELTSIKCPKCNSKKIGMGEGRSLSEDRSLRTVRASASLSDRLLDWQENGETGLSSESLFGEFTQNKDKRKAPRDLDDFRRCLLLLDWVPEVRQIVPAMGQYENWKCLSEAWDKIEASYYEEAPNMDKDAPKTSNALRNAL